MDNRLKLLSLLYYRQKQRKRQYWVRPIFQNRSEYGAFNTLIAEMRFNDVESYFNYFRMTPEKFDEVLNLVGPLIAKQDTFFRRSISPAERLAVTLRYLASGDSMASISYSFRISRASISRIIKETTSNIWLCLKDKVLEVPSVDKWVEIASDFNKQWNFPNCLGAIDGKHIHIQAPNGSSSQFYNYKGTFSIVLLAAVDANYNFIIVDIGAAGRNSDGGVFANSSFSKALKNFTLNVPAPQPLPHSTMQLPFVFVADEAFPLKQDLMRPYPGKHLPLDKVIFNYRLSRARRCVENSFGIMSSRFRIFRKPIIAKTETVENIVKACVCLHNFLKQSEKNLPANQRKYCPPGFADTSDVNGKINDGQWRHDVSTKDEKKRLGPNMYSQVASNVRDQFKNYFNADGAVSWQVQHVIFTE